MVSSGVLTVCVNFFIIAFIMSSCHDQIKNKTINWIFQGPMTNNGIGPMCWIP